METVKFLHHANVLDIFQVLVFICLFSRRVLGLKLSSGEINVTLRLPLDHLAGE